MKMLLAAFAVAMALVSGCTHAEDQPAADVAKALATLDARDGIPPEWSSQQQMTDMLARSGVRCARVPGFKDSRAAQVASMVVNAHGLLDKNGVYVSRFDLLDVVNSMLGDGRADRDCAAILGMYVQFRTNKKDPMTHIGAYKILQAMRDNVGL